MTQLFPIKDYEGLYSITKDGRVYSHPKKIGKGYHNGRWLKIQTDAYGYNVIGLSKKSEVKNYKIHRLLAETFIDNPNNLPIVNHKDGIKLNISLDNLEWMTCMENNVHAMENNLTYHPNKQSKYNGIHWYQDRMKWRGQKMINGIRKRTKYYSKEKDAYLAYNELFS